MVRLADRFQKFGPFLYLLDRLQIVVSRVYWFLNLGLGTGEVEGAVVQLLAGQQLHERSVVGEGDRLFE